MFRLCLILLLLASSQAMARDFRYRNNRFGTSAMIPDSFYPKPGPINGDGRTFRARDWPVRSGFMEATIRRDKTLLPIGIICNSFI